MEIFEAIGWVALGFVPALATLEIASRIIAIRSVPKKTTGAGDIEFTSSGLFMGSRKKSSARPLPIGIGVELLYTGAPELIKDIQSGMEEADFEGFAPLPELPL